MRFLLLLSCLLVLPACHAIGTTAPDATVATGTPDGLPDVPFAKEIDDVAEHPYIKALGLLVLLGALIGGVRRFLRNDTSASSPTKPPRTPTA